MKLSTELTLLTLLVSSVQFVAVVIIYLSMSASHLLTLYVSIYGTTLAYLLHCTRFNNY